MWLGYPCASASESDNQRRSRKQIGSKENGNVLILLTRFRRSYNSTDHSDFDPVATGWWKPAFCRRQQGEWPKQGRGKGAQCSFALSHFSLLPLSLPFMPLPPGLVLLFKYYLPYWKIVQIKFQWKISKNNLNTVELPSATISRKLPPPIGDHLSKIPNIFHFLVKNISKTSKVRKIDLSLGVTAIFATSKFLGFRQQNRRKYRN